MLSRGSVPSSIVVLAAGAAIALAVTTTSVAQQPVADAFAVLTLREGEAVAVPPRALAVIPERHTDRRIRFVDTLIAIDPQFDDLATGAGLDGRIAIQLRTQEARVPIFVRKNDATIATMLQLAVGSRILVTGILVPRGARYLFLAAEVRPSPTRTRER